MTDKIDTSTLGRIDLTSGKSPAPIEECVSTWAVDDLLERLRADGLAGFIRGRPYTKLRNPDGPEAADRIQSLIADNERLRTEVAAIVKSWLGDHAISLRPAAWRELRDALSHKDMSRG